MKLISKTTTPVKREWRVSDYYTLDGSPLPDFCKGKEAWEIVRVEIFGHNITAQFQKQKDEPMPDTVEIPEGTLKCIQCDEYGVVTADGYFPANAQGELLPPAKD
jgi:hypothetical protein